MELTPKQKTDLMSQLQERFKKNQKRHPEISWDAVAKKLAQQPEKLRALYQMEESGGEPDVLVYDQESDTFHFYDCSPESPKGRRSCCYDREARINRKKFPPEHSAEELAESWGVQLLTEEQYQYLQGFGEFDLKTSSWLKTPDSLRKLGGALFGDRRFGRVFTYHNGADSYYGARGFRLILKL
ncbi:DUF4256 domain-containing protein [Algoriphagus hitonicola]|uniref:DUF4256 domain-containing protein n=1 Tax=Algoriphagus hitonicola TaxID=435880 RepID=A0A1I2T839_9BACT|nr:DUF4256 domain-containing protein [Algoriphagus hitonicola]SFG60990.1 Protein of unknown function [Algoriphagus hitonicola]